MKKFKSIFYILAIASVICASYLFFDKPEKLWADSATANVHGFAWSGYSTARGGGGSGWISMNCKEGSPTGGDRCGSSVYGVDLNVTTGNLSGHAWSSNLGWISFDSGDVSGCPVGSCQGHVNVNTGTVSGWARAISVPKTGNNAQNGGWNGWIELAGTNHTSPNAGGTGGVTYLPSAKKFTGYAWGGTLGEVNTTEIIGWVDFSAVTVDVTPPTVNPDFTFSISSGFGQAITGYPTDPGGTGNNTITVQPGANLQIEWASPNNIDWTTCTAADTWAPYTPTSPNNGNGYNQSRSMTAPNTATGNPYPYTIQCRNGTTNTGPLTLYVIVIDSSSNEVLMGLSPACVIPGQTFEVTWRDLGGNMVSCRVHNPSAAQSAAGWNGTLAPSGSMTMTATAGMNGQSFKLICTDGSGDDYPDPNQTPPYFETPKLQVVANLAMCQGPKGRIIWNEK